MDNFIEMAQYLLSSDIRMASPVLIAALGLVIMEKSGIVNLGCEGTMLLGSFTAVYFSRLFGGPWLGLLGAGVCGMVVGLFFALIVVGLRANQIVTGISFNLVILGLTSTLNRLVFGLSGQAAKAPNFTPIEIPGLSSIPLIGPFFSQMGPVYLAFLMVPALDWFFKKTTIGLRIRSVGEYPQAADVAGVNVQLTRFLTIIAGSFFISVAGGFLSIGLLSIFTENMVSGRGFIAMAVVIFGKWSPWGILAAALLFGFGDAAQIKLQTGGSSVPYQILMMIPYILTILALSGFVGRSRAPAASGKPYSYE